MVNSIFGCLFSLWNRLFNMRVFFYVKIYAFLSVSINHIEYFKGKYGILYTENILRKGVQILQESAKEDVKICRVSENIFCFWLMEPAELELYIQQLKEAFRKKGEEENLPFSFSIGAIYNRKRKYWRIDWPVWKDAAFERKACRSRV